MAGQRHPTGYMRRAICDKQKSFSSDLIPLPRPLRRRRVLQQGDYQGNPASWRAQALRAGRTWHEDGHPFGALRGESSWQSLSLCKVLPSVPGTLFFPLIWQTNLELHRVVTSATGPPSRDDHTPLYGVVRR